MDHIRQNREIQQKNVFLIFCALVAENISAQWRNFQKPRGKIEVLPLIYGKVEKNCSFGQKPSCPANFGEKLPDSGENTLFHRNWRDIMDFSQNCNLI